MAESGYPEQPEWMKQALREDPWLRGLLGLIGRADTATGADLTDQNMETPVDTSPPVEDQQAFREEAEERAKGFKPVRITDIHLPDDPNDTDRGLL